MIIVTFKVGSEFLMDAVKLPLSILSVKISSFNVQEYSFESYIFKLLFFLPIS